MRPEAPLMSLEMNKLLCKEPQVPSERSLRVTL